MTITIDPDSGFCAGVTGAIKRAEEQLAEHKQLFCLGDIVHNEQEVARLEKKGLVTVYYDDLRTLHHVPVLIRAHGEPPSTYRIAQQNGIDLIDGTCPVVRRLQQRIAACYNEHRNDGAQIVIFGKKGHAEVIGLCGQTDDTAIVIEHPEELRDPHPDPGLNFSRPVYLFSQTTKDITEFNELVSLIAGRMHEGVTFEYYDTICRAVANRVNQIAGFARQHDAVLFAGGAKSSNGQVLYNRCKTANPNTYFISSVEDLQQTLHSECLTRSRRIGITGATSTPRWIMDHIKDQLLNIKL